MGIPRVHLQCVAHHAATREFSESGVASANGTGQGGSYCGLGGEEGHPDRFMKRVYRINMGY